MTDKRPWTQEEDRLLKFIYQTSKLTKWSNIARMLQQNYGIKGRNGKQCKQRYITHIDTSHPKQEWNYTDQQRLFQLHNQLGNKWAEIGNKLQGRTDNCVKNHFYSKLRKAVKKLNKVIMKSFRKEIKEIKPNILYKIVEVVEEQFKQIPKFDKQFSGNSNKLKNQLLDFSYDDEVQQEKQQDDNINVDTAKQIIDQIAQFSLNYKKKTKKSKNTLQQDLLTPHRYQRIKKCNSQNQESEGSSSMMHSSDTSNFQDISDDEINRANNSKRSRKNSQQYGSNNLTVGRIRTRAYSQGNARDRSQEIKNMKDETLQQQKQQQNKQLQQQFGDLNIFEEDENIPPHPLLMKKQTSKYSRYSQNVVQKQQYRFFEDSQIEMRILPQMDIGPRKVSQYEDIFN